MSSGPTVRPTDPEFAPGQEVKFADGFPVLVARLVRVHAVGGLLECLAPCWLLYLQWARTG